MEILRLHVRKYFIRGLLAAIPLSLSVLAIHILYQAIDQRVMKMIYQFSGFRFPGMGLLLLMVAVYLTGLLASSFVGRQFFNMIDNVALKVPLIKTTQKIGQQLSGMLSLPEKQIFKRAVFVPYLKPGVWTIGFVTGEMVVERPEQETLLKVFIPTPPNPFSGTMVIIRETEILDPGWSVEDAVKTVISGGIIGPSELFPDDKIGK